MLNRRLIGLFALLVPGALPGPAAAAGTVRRGRLLAGDGRAGRIEVGAEDGEAVEKRAETRRRPLRRPRRPPQPADRKPGGQPTGVLAGRRAGSSSSATATSARCAPTAPASAAHQRPEVDAHPHVAPNGRYVVFERRAAGGAARPLHGRARRRRRCTPSPRRRGRPRSTSHPTAGRSSSSAAGRAGGGAATTSTRCGPRAPACPADHTGRVDEFAPRYFEGGIVYSRGQSGEGPGAYADIYTMRRNGTQGAGAGRRRRLGLRRRRLAERPRCCSSAATRASGSSGSARTGPAS